MRAARRPAPPCGGPRWHSVQPTPATLALLTALLLSPPPPRTSPSLPPPLPPSPPPPSYARTAGGWFNREPPGWQRATVGAFAIMGVCGVAGFSVSAGLERRPSPPLWPIASQQWSAHAKEDDPAR